MTPVSTQSGGPGEPRSTDERAVGEAINILQAHRIMAISTIRPDGWPQTTIVGYANEGLSLYFMILRSSQKYSNISRDDRVSIAVGDEPAHLHEAKAVFAGATQSKSRVQPNATVPGNFWKRAIRTCAPSSCRTAPMPW
jgi:hypothetical protein